MEALFVCKVLALKHSLLLGFSNDRFDHTFKDKQVSGHHRKPIQQAS